MVSAFVWLLRSGDLISCNLLYTGFGSLLRRFLGDVSTVLVPGPASDLLTLGFLG